MVYLALVVIALVIVPQLFITARRWYLYVMQQRCIEKYMR